ncbi:MAG TPA: hypothetical protein VJ697_01670 [Nitrososphaeraceae archaeon]|nr:hypothetical protein [Nitrososphaeraceae archaeon]
MQKINYYHFKTFLTTPYTGNDIERFKKIEESVSRNNQLSMEEKFNLLERFKDEKDYFFVLNGEKEAERLCNNCKNFCLAIKYCEKCVRNYLKNQTWTSGNEEVDSIIVDFQQNTLTPNMVIEWIPYDNFEKFNNRMFWKEGPYDKWNSEFVKLERFGKREVILKEMKGFEKELVIVCF